MNYWLRLYTGILDDPKVQRLSPEHFKGWINLLCLAKEHDGLLPSIEDIAFRLRISEAEAQGLVEELVRRGLLDQTEDGLAPHKWHERQFVSDTDPTAAIRARRYRANKQEETRDATVTSRTSHGPRAETETEYKAESETEESREAAPASRAKSRSARRPPACDEEFLAELQQNPAYAVFDVTALFHKMVAWCQVKGKQPTRARLVNWLNRQDRPMTAIGGNNGNFKTTQTGANDANRRSAQGTTEEHGIRDCKIL